jgi:RNA recognition motif-containing protein
VHVMSLGASLCLSVLLLQLSSVSAWVPSSSSAVLGRPRMPTALPMAAMSSYNSNKNNSNNKSQGQQQAKAKPAFAQPAFRQAAHQQSKPKPKQQPSSMQQQPPSQATDVNGRKIVTGGDSAIGIAHRSRVKNAGRVGTKRYVNPCKVFTGNLPFTYTAADLSNWICDTMGMPSHILLNECKIIKDWKTGVSKGFGFCVFTEAVYATVCIDKCHNLMLEGRAVTVKQGVKKAVDNVLYVKKDNVSLNPEEDAITSGIDEAGDNDDDSDSDEGSTSKGRKDRRRREKEERLDPYEEAIVRKLDPDLVDGRLDDNALFFEFANKNIDEDDDDVDDFDGDYDDSDDGVDGIWIENSGPVVSDDEAMNRQSRRESAKRQKRKKLPSKGFGN